MDVGPLILALSLLTVGSILAGAAGQKVDAPILLVFLVAGMLAGREGPGGLVFDNSEAALIWGAAALAAILFDGGLRTRPSVFASGFGPGLALALPGTVITALLVLPIAIYAFDLGVIEAFLIAAVICSTDAAAVFALASTGVSMPKRVAATLEVESGLNDPVGVLLVVGLTEVARGAGMGPMEWAFAPLIKLVGGGLVGIGAGYAGALIHRRVSLPPGLRAILAAGIGFFAFGVGETVGASGFMAVYVAGVAMAWKAPGPAASAAPGVDGIAWLAQTGLFLMLGLLITPSHLAAVAVPATLTALGLIFIARPAAAFLTLWPFGFRLNETLFVSWAGLRGATPVFLGLIPSALGLPNANLYLSAAAIIVLLSLIIQGWNAPLVARFLGMSEEDERPAPAAAWARAGALSMAIGTGLWFATALRPQTAIIAQAPETTEDLRALLADPAPLAGPPLITQLPADFPAMPPEDRQALFARTVYLALDVGNAELLEDRKRAKALAGKIDRGARLSLTEDAEWEALARRYGSSFSQTEEVLRRIDVVPPALGTAQAVLATGWGVQSRALEDNDLFARRKPGGYADLLSAAKDYLVLINTHPDFAPLRRIRADIPEADRTGEEAAKALAPGLAPYAASGEAYVRQVIALLDRAEIKAASQPLTPLPAPIDAPETDAPETGETIPESKPGPETP
ncbi:MAG: potassium/proton antiporter [Pseudomonadota bacterium]